MAFVEARMSGGDGEASYARNSVIQRKQIIITKPSRDLVVKSLCKSVFPTKGRVVVVIAELGCSTGPNALIVPHEIVTSLVEELSPDDLSPEFQVFLNDLPGTDFNTTFKSVPGLLQQLETRLGPRRCFFNGVPGSFYGRLFPSLSLHFVHASSTLHYLSQVPKGIQSKEMSVESVGKAYSDQFDRDFSTFLKCRGEELVSGGCVVFTLHGRRDDLPPNHPCSFGCAWLFFKTALAQMASEGLVDKDKVDSFNMPLYAPSLAEIKELVKRQGSFSITNSDSFEVNNYTSGVDSDGAQGDEHELHERRIRYLTTSKKSGMMSLLQDHFGDGFPIDEVFRKYEAINRECLTEDKARIMLLTVTLTKTS